MSAFLEMTTAFYFRNSKHVLLPHCEIFSNNDNNNNNYK